VLIYKTADVIHFAQGELAMFATFIAWLITALRLPFLRPLP
jgi:branched-subunit amino acid ABC-type transport system permease component